jgi:hypothetical protein
MQKRVLLSLILGIFLISFVSAFTLSDLLENIESSTVLLVAVFTISFAILNFALSKFFKDKSGEPNKAIVGVIAFVMSFLITYGINKTGFDIEGLFFNIGISSELLYTIIPIIIIGGLALIIWKYKKKSLFILGGLLILLSFFIYEKTLILTLGIILVIIGIGLSFIKKKPRINSGISRAPKYRATRPRGPPGGPGLPGKIGRTGRRGRRGERGLRGRKFGYSPRAEKQEKRDRQNQRQVEKENLRQARVQQKEQAQKSAQVQEQKAVQQKQIEYKERKLLETRQVQEERVRKAEIIPPSRQLPSPKEMNKLQKQRQQEQTRQLKTQQRQQKREEQVQKLAQVQEQKAVQQKQASAEQEKQRKYQKMVLHLNQLAQKKEMELQKQQMMAAKGITGAKQKIRRLESELEEIRRRIQKYQ